MRTDKNPDIFFNKMKKKPALQKILDNLDGYTAEELEKVKGQPLWIKKQLVKLKNRSGNTSENIAIEMANDMERASKKERIELSYEVRRWLGEEWQMPTGRTGTLKLYVNYGDVFLLIDEDNFEVKISSSFGKLRSCWNYFLQHTEHVNYMTMVEFAKFLSDDLAKRHGLDNGEVNDSTDDPNVEDRGSFRIIRHNTR